MASDLIQLIAILAGGFLVLILGRIIQKNAKSKKVKQSNLDGLGVSEEESRAKSYIEQYKSSYTKESIKAGLISMGISDSSSQNYVEKYF